MSLIEKKNIIEWNQQWSHQWGRIWGSLKKTNTTHDIIKIYAFTKYRGIGLKYKSRKFSEQEFRQRLWWKQELIRFDKPGWWNEITGWQNIGLNRVLEVKGPKFYNWRWGKQPIKIKLHFVQTLLYNKNQTNSFYAYPINYKINTYNYKLIIWQFIPTLIQAVYKFSYNQQINFKAVIFPKNQIYDQLRQYNQRALVYKFIGFNQISFQESWKRFLINPSRSFYQLSNKVIHYLILFTNIKPYNYRFKTLYLLNQILLNVKRSHLKFNSHYLGTLNFRITLLFQLYGFMSASLLSLYYTQQFSRITARKMQRWYIRDIKRFNAWLFRLQTNNYTVILNLSHFQGLKFNIKGRAVDSRRVFSRQHLFGIKQPKSKYITTYNNVYTNHNEYFTTRWGSTNLRVDYFYNPYYHNNFESIASQQFTQRLFWSQALMYLLTITHSKLKSWIVLNNICSDIILQTGQITIRRGQKTTTWAKTYAMKPVRRSNSQRDIYFLIKQKRQFMGPKAVINTIRTKPYNILYNRIQELSDKKLIQKVFFPLPNFIIHHELFPQNGKTVKLWLKLLKKNRWRQKRKSLFIKKFIDTKRKYKKRKNKLTKFRRITWFQAGLCYETLGVSYEICSKEQVFFNYKKL